MRKAARLALSGAFAQTYINLYLAYADGDIADRDRGRARRKYSISPRAVSMPGWRMPRRWNRPRRLWRWPGWISALRRPA